uniref:Altered inheritance of mitochondria protein 24, mitochondrial n=1 Tax=Entomoneis paludosa TaxID=265537 RepID=A0A7S2VDB0_9STRA
MMKHSRQSYQTALCLFLVLLIAFPCLSLSFTAAPKAPWQPMRQRSLKAFRLNLSPSDIVRSPSQEEAVELGTREWPQQLKKGTWTESISVGQSLVRYVLEGSGSVEIISLEEGDGSDDATAMAEQSSLRVQVRPGSLLEIAGEATVSWTTTSEEMIILTPGYEEGGNLIFAAAALLVLCVTVAVSGLGG